MDVKEYLIEAFSSYQDDPPDSAFQRGSLYAMLELAFICEPAIYEMYKHLQSLCNGKVEVQ